MAGAIRQVASLGEATGPSGACEAPSAEGPLVSVAMMAREAAMQAWGA